MRPKSIFVVSVLVLFCVGFMTAKVSARGEPEIGDLRGRCDEDKAGLEDIRGRFDEIEFEFELEPEKELQIEIEIEDLQNEAQILEDAMARRGDQATAGERRLLGKLLRKLELRKNKLDDQIELLEKRLGIHP